MQNLNYETLFKKYQDDRLILKYQEYAKWTVPGVFPKDSDPGLGRNQQIEQDFQSLGALLINNLSAKLCNVLFPQNMNFFKVEATDQLIKALGSKSAQEDIKKTLLALENKANKQAMTNGGYAALNDLIQLLLITGNALCIRKNNRIIVRSLRDYAYLRDNSGYILDLILKETMLFDSLVPELRAALSASGKQYQWDSEVKLYTRVKTSVTEMGRMVTISAQADGLEIGEPATYPEMLSPFIPVALRYRWGDNYGRGMVEDYAGAFAKLSALSEALTFYELEACKVINLVKPGATVDLQSLENAKHGDYVYGDPNSISKLETGTGNKIAEMLADIESVFGQLAKAFLYEGNVRQAERVTAEEIKMTAEEADRTQGGLYSSISTSIHIPLAHVLSYEVDPEILLALHADQVEFSISTGLAAIGRAQEVSALLQATQEIGMVVPILTQISQRWDKERIAESIMYARGLDPKEYSFTEKELEQLQEQLSQQQQDLQGMAAATEQLGTV